VHDGDLVRHAVQLEATVKVLRDAGRQLRPDFLGLRHQAAFFFDPAGRPGARRRLRRQRPFLGFVFPVEMLPSNDWIAERTSWPTAHELSTGS